MQQYDVIIIGAGLMGCFAARHLAQRGYSVAVLERQNDVSMGISRANTSIVYAGYDMKPGTLKARLTVEGNAAFADLCAELKVPFKRCGSLMLAFGPRGYRVLKEKLAQGQTSGVPGLQLLDASELPLLEPGVSSAVIAALYAPSTGTVNPWQLCLAAAQDAHRKGAEFLFEHEVEEIRRSQNSNAHNSKNQQTCFCLRCANNNEYEASVVVNCTGVDADRTSELIAPVSFRLSLTSGSYLVLDTTAGDFLQHIVFSEPEIKGKGITLVPTIEGNLMLGPSEEQMSTQDREPGYVTTESGLGFVQAHSQRVLPALPLNQTIRSFGTLRPNIKRAGVDQNGKVLVSDESIHDFHIEWAKDTPGFLNIAGVKTPGLTCADGIGRYAADLVEEHL